MPNKKMLTDTEIISSPKEHEDGEKTTDICRKLGVGRDTFYVWKK